MDRLVAFVLRQQTLMVALLVFVCGTRLVSFFRLNIEAYPDPVPPLVDIVTQNPGQSAEEMERYVTIPVEIQMSQIPHVSAIRTISLFGLSDVKLQFTYDVTYDQAEQAAINQLSQLSSLPTGVKPQISPWSPIGEIFRYRVVGPPGLSVTDLRTIEDWQLERRFKAVPGVIDVNGWGGKSKTYEVSVDLKKLNDAGITLQQVIQALGGNDLNVGGQTLEFRTHAAVIRGVGLVQSIADIEKTMLSANSGSPILVKDVATVEASYEPRLGIAGQDDDDDIVQGIVLMRRGEQTTPTIHRVEAEMDEINNSGILPADVRLERIYDRSGLIGLTTKKRSTIPLTSHIAALIFVASSLERPKIRAKRLTEFSPLTPEAASSTLSSIYCEKLKETPARYGLAVGDIAPMIQAGTSEDRRAAQHRRHSAAAAGVLSLAHRHGLGGRGHAPGVGRRRLRLGHHRDAIQCLHSDRVHRPVRHIGDGGNHHSFIF